MRTELSDELSRLLEGVRVLIGIRSAQVCCMVGPKAEVSRARDILERGGYKVTVNDQLALIQRSEIITET